MKNKRIWSLILVFVFMLQSICISTVSANNATYTKNDFDTTVSSSALTADNGTIELMADENNATALNDIVLVLDSSGSMDGDRMPTLKEASIKFSESVLKTNPNSRIAISAFGVYGYSNEVKTFDFTNDLEELTNNINSLYNDGGTPIHSGIHYADKLFMDSWNENSVKSMVIMSDGAPDSKSSALEAYNSVADKYNIYSVYLGSSSSAKSFMEKIQNCGFFNAEDVNSLIEQFVKIADKILNPINAELTHKLIYNFYDKVYEISLKMKNTNDINLSNIKVSIKVPESISLVSVEGLSYELDENSKISDVIVKNLDSKEENSEVTIVWKAEIFQEKEDCNYEISADIKAENMSAITVYDKIYVQGYGVNDKTLDLSSDTWNFANYGGYLNIDSISYNGLLQNMNNAEKEEFKQSVDETVGGHCYGMSSIVALIKSGALNISDIGKSKSKVHDFSQEDADKSISYYSATQFLPLIKDARTELVSMPNHEALENIVNKVRLVSSGGCPVVIGFNIKEEKNFLGITTSEGGGHAVVGYDFQRLPDDKSVTFPDNHSYNSRILIYDPNYPNEEAWIYLNSDIEENSGIVHVTDDKILYIANGVYVDGGVPFKGYHEAYEIEYFKYGINNADLLNYKNIDSATKTYSSWLRVLLEQDKKRVIKVISDTAESFNITNAGIEDKSKIGIFDDNENNSNLQENFYNIKLDSDKLYRLINEQGNTDVNASISYLNYFCSAHSKNANGVCFSPDGYVKLTDNKSSYDLLLTSNDGYSSLPWYTITVEGTDKAQNPSLKNTGNGYLFEGEELSNIKVTANNDDETKELTFDSDKTSVLITNDGDDLVVKEDTDGDGNYETPIADSDGKINSDNTTESTTEQRDDNKKDTSDSNTKSSSGSGGGKSSRKASDIVETTTEATKEASEEKISSGKKIMVTIGEKAVVVGDKTYSIDVAPYIQTSSNSTLVPLRFVALAIGGENADTSSADGSKNISWDAVNKTATITVNNHTIQFKADSNIMIVDGVSKVMDNGVKAEISSGRMFIPFRALGEALGVSVDWDANSKTAIYTVK